MDLDLGVMWCTLDESPTTPRQKGSYRPTLFLSHNGSSKRQQSGGRKDRKSIPVVRKEPDKKQIQTTVKTNHWRCLRPGPIHPHSFLWVFKQHETRSLESQGSVRRKEKGGKSEEHTKPWGTGRRMSRFTLLSFFTWWGKTPLNDR